MRILKVLFSTVIVFTFISSASEAVSLKRVTCASMLKIIGDRTSDSSEASQIQQTLNAIGSMSAFRQSALLSASNMPRHLREAIANSISVTEAQYNPKPGEFVGFHLVGTEVSEFLTDLTKTTETFHKMSRQADLKLLREMYWSFNALKTVSVGVALTLLPLTLKIFELDHITGNIAADIVLGTVASGISLVGGAITAFHMSAGPLFLKSRTFAIDHKFLSNMENFKKLVNDPREDQWAFASAGGMVRNELINFLNKSNDPDSDFDRLANLEFSNKDRIYKDLFIKFTELLTVQRDQDGHLVPVLDIVLQLPGSP